MKEFWVLWWEYSDHSGNATISRVYADKTRAEEDFALVKEIEEYSREWHLDKAPFYGDSPQSDIFTMIQGTQMETENDQ